MDRRDLHNIMRKLEDLGLAEKFLQKPWKGGKHYALWNAVWASNSDIQLAIEEHNHSLEKESFVDIPSPLKALDESSLIHASLNPEDQAHIRLIESYIAEGREDEIDPKALKRYGELKKNVRTAKNC